MKAYYVSLLLADVVLFGYAADAEHGASVDPANTLSRMGDRLLDVQTQLAQMEAQRAYHPPMMLIERCSLAEVLKKNIQTLVPRVNAGISPPAASRRLWARGR